MSWASLVVGAALCDLWVLSAFSCIGSKIYIQTHITTSSSDCLDTNAFRRCSCHFPIARLAGWTCHASTFHVLKQSKSRQSFMSHCPPNKDDFDLSEALGMGYFFVVLFRNEPRPSCNPPFYVGSRHSVKHFSPRGQP